MKFIKIRFFTLFLMVLLLALTIRLTEVFDNLRDGEYVITRAAAEDEGDTSEDNKKSNDDEKVTESNVQAEGESKQPQPEKTKEQIPRTDPLGAEFNADQIEILERLKARRMELDAKEQQLEEKARMLKITERKLNQKTQELATLKQKMETLLDQQQSQQEGRIKKLVSIYEKMKPSDAARIFNALDFNVLMSIVENMSERRSSAIIAEMNADKARQLSAELALQNSIPRE